MAKLSPLVAIPPLAFAGLALVFYMGLGGDDQLPSSYLGRKAPELDVTEMPGLPNIDPAILADGDVKLVNFWASWCAPCRVEHPSLTALADEGVSIYGVNYKDLTDNAVSFLEELGNPYLATGADRNGRNAVDWGVYGVPETFVVDGEGKIVLRFAGPVTKRVLDDQLRPALEQAAAGQKPLEAVE